jgi:hypothetical protein
MNSGYVLHAYYCCYYYFVVVYNYYWQLEAEGIGARGAAAAAASSTSSRQQPSPADPQMQQIRSRTTVIHDHLPDPSGGSRSRAAAGEGLLPSVEAGSAERDLLVGLRSTSARIRPPTPHRYHPAGLWFRLEAASHQLHTHNPLIHFSFIFFSYCLLF